MTEAERQLGCRIELPPGWDPWFDAPARHTGDAGPPRAVGALDGADGWRVIAPDQDGARVTLRPCAATAVVRALAGLLLADVLVG